MTTTQSFLENWINAEHSLLGRTLEPLSLRHLLWLHAIQSPLVITDKTVTLADLELAALICSSTSDAQLTFFNAQKLPCWRKWSEHFWRWKNKGCDLQQETIAFLRYQDDYLKLPEFWEAKKNAGDCPLPYLLTHAAGLIANTGWSEETVFNMPIGKVIWLNIAFAFFKTGETNVMGDSDIAAREALSALYSPSLTK